MCRVLRNALFFVFIFVYHSGELKAQINSGTQVRDSLLHMLSLSQKKALRLELLLELTQIYRHSLSDSGLIFGQEALDLAKNQYQLGNGPVNLGKLYDAHSQLGNVYLFNTKDVEAMNHFLESLYIAEEINDTNRIKKSLYLIATIFTNIGNHDKAVEFLMRTYYLAEKANDTEEMRRLNEELRLAYLRNKEFEKSIVYLDKEYQWVINTNNQKQLDVILLNYAITYREWGKYPEAFRYFRNIQDKYPEGDYPGVLRNFNFHLAQLYRRTNQYAEAIDHFKAAIDNESNPIQKAWNSGIYAEAILAMVKDEDYPIPGQLGSQSGNILLAKNLTVKSIEGSRIFGIDSDLKYGQLSDIQSLLGDFEGALASYKLYHSARDSINSTRNSKHIVQKILEYEFAQKEAEAKAVREKQENRQRFIRNIFALGLICTLVVFFVVYYQRNKMKRANRLLDDSNQKLSSAIVELKSTQAQLVQQEKLASLGQLTAGIAHEIKNPLNFVNNFSEVNLELVEEIRAEIVLAKTQDLASQDPAPQRDVNKTLETVNNILDDIQSNLSKIHQHGTRADGIVRSMLMHSRGGAGKLEPVDLNALIREYVNLAFHGMRAGRNPINVTIDLQLDKNIGVVELIAEDFSRVILNLCNNAFDAMCDKYALDESYQPLLTVRTSQQPGVVRIEVQDNGPGIPDEIKDKILQPFFTTKKGTQGTGLGLSITNDIIKAHGGRLDVKSSPGKGTTFTIHLEKKG